MNHLGLEIKDLKAKVEEQEILRGVNLNLKAGEVHALMGPNGSGKSSLAYVLAGHPDYQVTNGEVCFYGEDLLGLAPEARARKGVFLSFQHPLEIPGVNLTHLLYTAGKQGDTSEDKNLGDLSQQVRDVMTSLGLAESLSERGLNEGFSGGEKKKAEIVQLQILNPRLVILDEIDSGLDVDALQAVGSAVKGWFSRDKILLVITHYNRILRYLKPDYVHIMQTGRIVRSGDYRLGEELEESGYSHI